MKEALSRDGQTWADSGHNFRRQPISLEDGLEMGLCGKGPKQGQLLTVLTHDFTRLPTALCSILAFMKQPSAY